MSNGRLTKQDLSPSLAQEINNTAAQAQDLETRSEEFATQLAQTVHLSSFPRLNGETEDTGRIQRAINSLESGQKLIIPEGDFYSKDLEIAKRNVSLEFFGTINYTGEESAIKISNYFITLINPRIRRPYETTGVAKEKLLYKAIDISNGKNFTLIKPDVEGFKYGVALTDNTGVGTAYISIYEPYLHNNLIAIGSDRNAVGAWTNELKVFGGRLSMSGTWHDMSDTAYFDYNGDNLQAIGTCSEGSILERKIKGYFSYSNFIGCRFEGSNGELDIVINGNNNNIIGCRGAFIYKNTGKRNVIQSQWKIENGMLVDHTVLDFESVQDDDLVRVGNEHGKYLINTKKSNCTVQMPSATNKQLEKVVFTIKKTDASSNTVNIIGIKLKNGMKSIRLVDAGETVQLFHDGKGYYYVMNDYTFNTTTALGGYDLRNFKKGTVLKNTAYDSYTHTHRVCTKAGTNGSVIATATGSSGDNKITITGEYSKFLPENKILIDDTVYEIVDIVDNVATLNKNLETTLSNAVINLDLPEFTNINTFM